MPFIYSGNKTVYFSALLMNFRCKGILPVENSCICFFEAGMELLYLHLKLDWYLTVMHLSELPCALVPL